MYDGNTFVKIYLRIFCRFADNPFPAGVVTYSVNRPLMISVWRLIETLGKFTDVAKPDSVILTTRGLQM
jgi:hypothetical protein